ncbi:MAG: type II toxin-antitoxin system RelE/ParE family toxin [Gammaproteobacteria bacterium]|nr:type II toxin-antitoxin system RelE/ParE family toxin [Gammaproteobacteria bacterium]
MMLYRLSAAARGDIVDILARTHERFGDLAAKRYEILIITALRDIAAEPDRPGSRHRPELGQGVRSWHLVLSRDRARRESGMVRRPRHFLIYRVDDDRVDVGRVLHDAMELADHFEAEQSWR